MTTITRQRPAAVILTPSAEARIAKLMGEAPAGTIGVKLSTPRRGCSGLAYSVDYVTEEVAFDEKNGEPLMGIARMPSGAWITVGAFGRALRSDDQGAHWEPLALPESVADKHLNRIVGSAGGQHWLLVGEQGLVLRSTDGGAHWAVVEQFYNGSLYNAMALPGGGWLAYGMRGHVFRSDGLEAPWTRSAMPAQVSFFGHATTADGQIVLVGQGSLVATSKDGGRNFSLGRVQGRANLTDLVLAPNGTGWLASDAGLQAFSAAATASTPSSHGAAQ